MHNTLTPWFSNTAKPVRPGNYDVRNVVNADETLVASWDGKQWFRAGRSKENSYPLAVQDREWRGLTNRGRRAANRFAETT
ncbi:hypothetical protein [Cupriavidus sp. HMR-1]|uniref:hypothetical protein n=1 Tax=Cupriavidus sp. HMR-1 TaxID=1249621 RepID=UPI0012675D35|nr:hypothetical protein [Cupriavidus sp. HMR-1]